MSRVARAGPRGKLHKRLLVITACVAALVPLGWATVSQAGLQVRLSRCIVSARDGKRQCLDDLGKARIPHNRYMMEGLVRNCSMESELAAFRCERD